MPVGETLTVAQSSTEWLIPTSCRYACASVAGEAVGAARGRGKGSHRRMSSEQQSQMASAHLHMNAGCREGGQAPGRRRSIEDDLRLAVLAGHRGQELRRRRLPSMRINAS